MWAGKRQPRKVQRQRVSCNAEDLNLNTPLVSEQSNFDLASFATVTLHQMLLVPFCVNLGFCVRCVQSRKGGLLVTGYDRVVTDPKIF